MEIVKSLSVLSHSHSHLHSRLLKPRWAYLLSFSSFAKTSKPPNPALFQYLIETFNFSKTQALTVSTCYSSSKSLENAQSVVHFFKNLGFSDSQIQSAARLFPHFLFANPDKCLKPKIKVFKDLGIVGYELGKLISKTSPILGASLKKKLVPCIEILKKHLPSDKYNEALVSILTRSFWLVTQKNPESRLLSNIEYCKSCGIVGSQLLMLLMRQPRLFVCKESALRGLVSRTLNMGFSANSKMFVHGLIAVYCTSEKTAERKYRIFTGFGFSEHQYREILRKAPYLLGSSEEKLKLRISFFVNTLKFGKDALVCRPVILTMSMEQRVIPRFKVLEILKSKKLIEEQIHMNLFFVTENVFVEKFISSFPDEAEELLLAYKCHTLASSSQEEKS